MKQLLILLCCCLCLIACNWDSTGPEGPEGPPGSPGQKPPVGDTSTIYGRVFTINQFATPLWPVEDVKITLYLKADSTLETTADASGYYYFNGIETGTYNLTMSRNGFGEMKVFGVTHISGGTLNTPVTDVALMEIPTQNIADSVWIYFPGTYVAVEFRVPPGDSPIPVSNYHLFFGNSADVSASNYVYHADNTFLYQKELLAPYFANGDSIYVRVYTLARGFTGSSITTYTYTDPASGRLIFPALSSGSALGGGVFIN